MGDVYTEAFVNTMHHSLAQVQNETPRDTLAKRLAEVRP